MAGSRVSSSRGNLGLLVALGAMAPLWWTWAASQATYRLYVMSGSPAPASAWLLEWLVVLPSCLLGLLAGFVTTLLLRETPLKGWAIFSGSVLLGATMEALLTRAPPLASVASYFSSLGNASFWVGSWVWPAIRQVRRRTLRPPGT